MCGIAGVVCVDGGAAAQMGRLQRASLAQARRGPDGSGEWVSSTGTAAFVHRRLSIIDPSDAASQPMVSDDGKLAVVFNGEIYNHVQLRRQLESEGRAFKTHSDTEVVLQMYRSRGSAMLRELRGMFAIAIWDGRIGQLLLARDTLGIKPLYYTRDARGFWFASQVKALQAAGVVSGDPEPAGHAGFFLWGYVPDPFTMYRGTMALEAGHVLTVDSRGTIKDAPFRTCGDILRDSASVTNDDAAATSAMAIALRDSVEAHMVADVPVGVFLSAGLDSSLIATLAAPVSEHPLRAVTLGFIEQAGGANDETALAAEVAEVLHVEHVVSWIRATDFQDARDDILAAMDQPSVDGVNTYFVSRAAARSGLKVALSGLGGDELLGGYASSARIPQLVRSVRPFQRMGRSLRGLAAPWIGSAISPKWAGIVEYGGTWGGAYMLRRSLFMPWEVEGLIGGDMARAGLETLATLPVLEAAADGIPAARWKIAALEMEWYMRGQLLRDADWAGMAHSLEIRVPFVDTMLLEAVSRACPSGVGCTKPDAIGQLGQRLPAAVIERRKTGFAVPMGAWLDGPDRPVSRVAAGTRDWARRLYSRFWTDA